MPLVTCTTGAQVGRWLRGVRRRAGSDGGRGPTAGGVRRQTGLTQTERSTRTGVWQRDICDLERGGSGLTISRRLVLAHALGVSLSGTGPDQDTP